MNNDKLLQTINKMPQESTYMRNLQEACSVCTSVFLSPNSQPKQKQDNLWKALHFIAIQEGHSA